MCQDPRVKASLAQARSESKSLIPYVQRLARLWQLLQGQGWWRLLIAVLGRCRRNWTICRLTSARRNESLVVVRHFQCGATSTPGAMPEPPAARVQGRQSGVARHCAQAPGRCQQIDHTWARAYVTVHAPLRERKEQGAPPGTASPLVAARTDTAGGVGFLQSPSDPH